MSLRVCVAHDLNRGYRCELVEGHSGDHQAFYMGGRAAAWPNDADKPREAAAGGATFDELLDHLDDLIALAAHEGYRRLALSLRVEREYLDFNRANFAEREKPPAASAGVVTLKDVTDPSR